MAVQAQFGGFAGCLPGGVEDHLFADEGALLPAAANNNWYYHCPAGVVSGAQSELTCNDGGGVLPPLSYSRKRAREQAEQYAVTSSLPAASTSGRTCGATVAQQDQDASSVLLLSELCRRQGAETDALVRAGCARLSAALERARKRQCLELARVVDAAAARRLRDAEAQLDAARRRAAELEERLRQAAAECQAWCGLARGHEAVAAELRAALEHVLATQSTNNAQVAAHDGKEGFGDSDPAACCSGSAADDAESCCFMPTTGDKAAHNKWACKACGEREASVLVLPCRHLCLCKACEPRLDACPVCLAAKNASIHVAPN